MCDFYHKLDEKHQPYEQRLALFIAYMIKKRYEKATIKTYISGIKYMLRNIIKVSVDDEQYHFSALIKSARYRNNKVFLRLPIKLNLLNRMLEVVSEIPRLQVSLTWFDSTEQCLLQLIMVF